MLNRMKDDAEKNLMALYRARMKDRAQCVTRRRRAVEAPPKKMSDLLTQFFGADSEAVRKLEENRALNAWDSYVGEAALRFSQAQRIRGEQLVVRVADPMWMQQLSLLKRELLKKYRTDFPRLNLRDIYFARG